MNLLEVRGKLNKYQIAKICSVCWREGLLQDNRATNAFWLLPRDKVVKALLKQLGGQYPDGSLHPILNVLRGGRNYHFGPFDRLIVRMRRWRLPFLSPNEH